MDFKTLEKALRKAVKGEYVPVTLDWDIESVELDEEDESSSDEEDESSSDEEEEEEEPGTKKEE